MSSQFKRTPRFAFPSSSSVPFPSSSAPFARRRAFAKDVDDVDDEVLSDASSIEEDNPDLTKEEHRQEGSERAFTSSPLSRVVSGRDRIGHDEDEPGDYVAPERQKGLRRFIQPPATQEDIESSPVEVPLFRQIHEEEGEQMDMLAASDVVTTQDTEREAYGDDNDNDNEHDHDHFEADLPSILTLTPRPKRRLQGTDDSPSLRHRDRDRDHSPEEEHRHYEPFDDLTANASSPVTSPVMSPMKPTSTNKGLPASNASTSPTMVPSTTATSNTVRRRHFLYQTTRPSEDRYHSNQRVAAAMTLPPDFSPHRNKRAGRGAQRFIPHGLAGEVRDWIIQSSTTASYPSSTIPPPKSASSSAAAAARTSSSLLFGGTSKKLFAPASSAITGPVPAEYADRVRVVQTSNGNMAASLDSSPRSSFNQSPPTHPPSQNQIYTPPLSLIHAISLHSDNHASTHLDSHPNATAPQTTPDVDRAQDQEAMNIMLLGQGSSSATGHGSSARIPGHTKGIEILKGDVIGVRRPTWTVHLPTGKASEGAAMRLDDQEGGTGEKLAEEWHVVLNWVLLGRDHA